MSDYITAEELKATLELTGRNFADHDIPMAISAASRGIDNVTGRRFHADTADATRYYTPSNPYTVEIDDLFHLTSVKVDTTGGGVYSTTWTLNTMFALEPLNAEADGKPWERIRLNPNGGQRFYYYPRSVQVIGKFGWEEIPDEVRQAATIIASRLIGRARSSPHGVVALGMDGEAVRIARFDPDITFLLGDLTRDSFFA